MRFEVRGTAELIAKLKAMKGAKAKAVLRKSTRAQAKVIAARAKTEWPTKSGETVRNIKVRALKRSRTRIGHTVRLQVASPTPYRSYVELGTRHMKPRGALKRTAETLGHSAVNAVLEAIEKEVL